MFVLGLFDGFLGFSLVSLSFLGLPPVFRKFSEGFHRLRQPGFSGCFSVDFRISPRSS